jgi:hypothetical protein
VSGLPARTRTLAGTVAHGVAGLQSAGDPGPFENPESFAAESERLVGA